MASTPNSFVKYGATWGPEYIGEDLRMEMMCIRKGGKWKSGTKECGMGLTHHYEAMRKLLWPKLDDHRWHRLCRDTILTSKVTVLMGCASSGKTHEASWIYLCEYFCFPEETCVLVSSTHMDGLKLRVWAEICMLWQQAIERYPFLPGYLIDSRILIATDNIDEKDVSDRNLARDWRKGIKGVPCIQNGKFVGIAKFCGIKQKRMRLIADEAQQMGGSFLSAFANLDKNEDFRAIILGNPNDPSDPLGKASEPKDGWGSHMEPKQTEVWETRFMNGRCVNLVGTDSPNFDFPPDQPTRYKYLISAEKIKNTLSFFPKDSVEYYSNCIGVMKVGILTRRVVTLEMCHQFDAFKEPVWEGSERTRILAMDSAYGGDRCILGHGDFGRDANGDEILCVYPPVVVPIIVRADMIAEDQIAVFARQYALDHDCKPENFYHDSTGRGSLGTALARAWSNLCNPVEFGGPATKRPVSLDLMIDDADTGDKRLKRCDEHYDRFITELWFSIRYIVEGRQMRNLPSEVADELCLRRWDKVRGDKISIEPKTGTTTKPGMKERVGFSPDMADWLATLVEGARRRGFQIKKLGAAVTPGESADDYFADEAKRWQDTIKSKLLKHV